MFRAVCSVVVRGFSFLCVFGCKGPRLSPAVKSRISLGQRYRTGESCKQGVSNGHSAIIVLLLAGDTTVYRECVPTARCRKSAVGLICRGSLRGCLGPSKLLKFSGTLGFAGGIERGGA